MTYFYFTPTAESFRGLAVIFFIEKELRTNHLVRQPRMFFDVIDRRYSKECPSNMIFTSNKTPDKWGEYFGEDSSLLCALDRIFDDALVFMIKGSSYRGQNCKTVSITAGELSPLPKSE